MPIKLLSIASILHDITAGIWTSFVLLSQLAGSAVSKYLLGGYKSFAKRVAIFVYGNQALNLGKNQCFLEYAYFCLWRFYILFSGPKLGDDLLEFLFLNRVWSPKIMNS